MEHRDTQDEPALMEPMEGQEPLEHREGRDYREQMHQMDGP